MAIEDFSGDWTVRICSGKSQLMYQFFSFPTRTLTTIAYMAIEDFSGDW